MQSNLSHNFPPQTFAMFQPPIYLISLTVYAWFHAVSVKVCRQRCISPVKHLITMSHFLYICQIRSLETDRQSVIYMRGPPKKQLWTANRQPVSGLLMICLYKLQPTAETVLAISQFINVLSMGELWCVHSFHLFANVNSAKCYPPKNWPRHCAQTCSRASAICNIVHLNYNCYVYIVFKYPIIWFFD